MSLESLRKCQYSVSQHPREMLATRSLLWGHFISVALVVELWLYSSFFPPSTSASQYVFVRHLWFQPALSLTSGSEVPLIYKQVVQGDKARDKKSSWSTRTAQGSTLPEMVRKGTADARISGEDVFQSTSSLTLFLESSWRTEGIKV